MQSTTTELGAVFDLGNNQPIDMRGMQALQVVAKKVTGANPENFGIVAYGGNEVRTVALVDSHDGAIRQVFLISNPDKFTRIPALDTLGPME